MHFQTSVSAAGKMNCAAPRRFWINWLDGFIRVGQGKLFTGSYMTWQDPEGHPIASAAVTSIQERVQYAIPTEISEGNFLF